MNVGVVGLGYVGSACKSLFKDYFNLNTFDINKNCNCSNIQDLTKKSDIIFICVGTPTKKGSLKVDLSYVYKCCKEILNIVNKNGGDTDEMESVNHDEIVALRKNLKN